MIIYIQQRRVDKLYNLLYIHHVQSNQAGNFLPAHFVVLPKLFQEVSMCHGLELQDSGKDVPPKKEIKIKKVDLKCKECEFVGKNVNGLSSHARLAHKKVTKVTATNSKQSVEKNNSISMEEFALKFEIDEEELTKTKDREVKEEEQILNQTMAKKEASKATSEDEGIEGKSENLHKTENPNEVNDETESDENKDDNCMENNHDGKNANDKIHDDMKKEERKKDDKKQDELKQDDDKQVKDVKMSREDDKKQDEKKLDEKKLDVNKQDKKKHVENKKNENKLGDTNPGEINKMM